MYSVLWWKNSSKGKRLRRNENLIDEVAYDGKSISFGRLVMEMMNGMGGGQINTEDYGRFLTVLSY